MLMEESDRSIRMKRQGESWRRYWKLQSLREGKGSGLDFEGSTQEAPNGEWVTFATGVEGAEEGKGGLQKCGDGEGRKSLYE